jgi:hypothetical protein
MWLLGKHVRIQTWLHGSETRCLTIFQTDDSINVETTGKCGFELQGRMCRVKNRKAKRKSYIALTIVEGKKAPKKTEEQY